MTGKKKPPVGLGVAGTELWNDIAGGFDLRPDELRVLEHACREEDLIASMDAELHTDIAVGAWSTKGSAGQDVAHPLLGEIRQHRTLSARLMAQLKLPDEGGGAQSRSSAARAMANARWSKSG